MHAQHVALQQCRIYDDRHSMVDRDFVGDAASPMTAAIPSMLASSATVVSGALCEPLGH